MDLSPYPVELIPFHQVNGAGTHYGQLYKLITRPNPHVYSIVDIVFAQCAVQSNSAKEQVGKLQYAFTGPWVIKAQLKGASYELEHCKVAGK